MKLWLLMERVGGRRSGFSDRLLNLDGELITFRRLSFRMSMTMSLGKKNRFPVKRNSSGLVLVTGLGRAVNRKVEGASQTHRHYNKNLLSSYRTFLFMNFNIEKIL